jgi:hypothetical protein
MAHRRNSPFSQFLPGPAHANVQGFFFELRC